MDLCASHPTRQLDEALIRTELAQALLVTPSHFDEAEDLVREAIQIYRGRGEKSPELANSLWVLGWIAYKKTHGLRLSGSENEGEMANREALDIIAEYTDKRSLTVSAKIRIGLACEMLRGDPASLNQASRFADEATKLLQRHAPHEHSYPMALRIQGVCQLPSGNELDAETRVREAMVWEQRATGAVEPDTLHVLMTALFQQGKYDEAFELAHLLQKNEPRPLPPSYVQSKNVVGCWLLELGDVRGAQEQLRTAWEDGRSYLGADQFATRECQFWLALGLAGDESAERRALAQDIFQELLTSLGDTSRLNSEPSAYQCASIIGHLLSPADEDVKLASEVNVQLLEQPLLPMRRLRNLYVGALLKNHAGDKDGAIRCLTEITELPVGNTWHPMPGVVPLYIRRNAEDLLAQILTDSKENLRAERVYRTALAHHLRTTSPDQFQIVLAKERLANFLRTQGELEEARELLTAASEELIDVPTCFDWLRTKVSMSLAQLGEPQESGS